MGEIISVENARKKKARFCGGETEKCGEKCAARRKDKQKRGCGSFFYAIGKNFYSAPVSYLDKADEIYYNKKLER